MSSYDIPSARQARMNDTEKRVPAIVALPPSRSGFVTRKRYPGISLSSMTPPALRLYVGTPWLGTAPRNPRPSRPARGLRIPSVWELKHTLLASCGRPPLLHSEPRPHLAVHRRCGGEVL